MKYFVKMEFIDPGVMLPERQFAELLEHKVIPSLQTLDKLEAEKKILLGGIPAGAKAITMVVEAANNDELDRLLHDLPLWGFMKVEVTPLQTFRNRAEQEQKALPALKAAVR